MIHIRIRMRIPIGREYPLWFCSILNRYFLVSSSWAIDLQHMVSKMFHLVDNDKNLAVRYMNLYPLAPILWKSSTTPVW